MPITHKITRAYQDSTGASIQYQENPVANSERNITQLVPIAANTHYTFALNRANLKSIALFSDQPLTIGTNAANGSSPTDTIVLAAGIPLIWSLAQDGLAKCPISANITAGMFITNAAGAAANFQMFALEAV